jgi:tight adherence protein B
MRRAPARLALGFGLATTLVFFCTSIFSFGIRPAVASTSSSAPSAAGASFDGSWTLPVGALALFAALFLAALAVLGPRERRRRLAAETVGAPRGAARGALADLGTQASIFAERTLARHDRQQTLEDALERAGMSIRPGEFILVTTAIVAGTAFLGLVLLGPLVAILAGVLAVAACRAFVAHHTAKRRAKFAEQLGGSLGVLAGSLRAGHSLVQAIDALVRESEAPTSDEFQRVLFEHRLGHPLDEALQEMARRVGNEDFEWVVQAIDIQHSVGGDLSSLLDSVARTIRDRNAVRRQVDALTAEGRLSAIILFCLPLGLFATIAIINPNYVDELTDTLLGNIMLVFAALLMGIGALWLRRVVRLVY